MKTMSRNETNETKKKMNNKYQRHHFLKLKHQKEFLIYFLRSIGYGVTLDSEYDDCKHIFSISENKIELIYKNNIRQHIEFLKNSTDEIHQRIYKSFRNENEMIDCYFVNFMTDILRMNGYEIKIKQKNIRKRDNEIKIDLYKKGSSFREEIIEIITTKEGNLVYDGTRAVYRRNTNLYCQGILLQNMTIVNNRYWYFQNNYFMIEGNIPDCSGDYPLINKKKIRYDFDEKIFSTFKKKIGVSDD